MPFISYLTDIKDIRIPNNVAIPKLSRVPTKTYSFFLLSLNLNIDFAAIKSPTALYCPTNIKARTKKRSINPISFPAFGKSLFSSTMFSLVGTFIAKC